GGHDGQVIYRHRASVVRRVISSEVAATLRQYLASAATDSGTGGRAQVRFGVIGKTGTAKLLVRGHYQRAYAASFAGIFPVKDPQLVVTVRIQNPRGQYYGGLVAAPITARMLRQALAARRSAIDPSRLVEAELPVVPRVADHAPVPQEEPTGPVAVSLPLPVPAPRREPAGEVPDVSGQDVRQAALAL